MGLLDYTCKGMDLFKIQIIDIQQEHMLHFQVQNYELEQRAKKH